MGRGLGYLLLLSALLAGWLGMTLLRGMAVLRTPPLWSTALPWRLVRDQGVIPAAQRQVRLLAERLPPDNPTVFALRWLAGANQETWREVVDALLPPEEAADLWAETLAQALAWSTTPRPAPSQNLDLTPWKQRLAQGAEDALAVFLEDLPPCGWMENAQLVQAALQGRWDVAPLCRPPRQALEVVWPSLVRQVQAAIQRLPDSVPWSEVVPAEVAVRWRRAFRWGPWLGWGALALGVVLALGGAWLAGVDLWGRLMWLNGALALYAAGLWALGRWGLLGALGLLRRGMPPESPVAGLAWQALRTLWPAMWAPVRPWALGLLGVCAGLWALGVLRSSVGRLPG